MYEPGSFSCEECYRYLNCWACNKADLDNNLNCGKKGMSVKKVLKDNCFVCNLVNCQYKSKH